MPTISLCMIVKNEEAVLERCLDSIADLMDEIIIVDTGSTDRTKEIASKYTTKFTTINGRTISLPHAIFLFLKRAWNIFMRRMQMKF